MSPSDSEGREAAVCTPFIFDTRRDSPDSSWGAVLPIMPLGPPTETPPYSGLMIVTSCLPFQLDAQFHPCVPRDSQPHHLRLESLNRPLPSPPLPSCVTCSWTLLSVSIQLCLQDVIEECDRTERNEHIPSARQHTQVVSQVGDV